MKPPPARTTGLGAAETGAQTGRWGYSTCPQGVSGSLQKAAQLPVPTPCAPHGLLHPPQPPEPARALHPPRRDPNPRPTLWTAPDSDSCRSLPLSRASCLHSCSPGASGSHSWEGIRKGVGSPELLHFQDPGVHGKERAPPRLPARDSSLDTAKLLLCKHTAYSLKTRKSGWPREQGRSARSPGAGRDARQKLKSQFQPPSQLSAQRPPHDRGYPGAWGRSVPELRRARVSCQLPLQTRQQGCPL